MTPETERQNIWSSFIYSFLCTITWPKTRILTDLFRLFDQNRWSFFIYSFFCLRSLDKKLGFSLIYFFYMYTTIWPKLGGHYYSLIYSLLTSANILHAIFMAVLPWYFVRYIHESTGLYIPYSLFMAVASLYFVRYIHGYLKSFLGNDNVKISYKLPNALNRVIFYYTILFPSSFWNHKYIYNACVRWPSKQIKICSEMNCFLRILWHAS